MKTLEQQIADRFNELGLPKEIGLCKHMDKFFEQGFVLQIIQCKDNPKEFNALLIPPATFRQLMLPES